MRKLGQLALIGIGLAIASQFFSGGEASPPLSAVPKAERCAKLGEQAGLVMAMRQMGGDQAQALDEFPQARDLITRAYAMPRLPAAHQSRAATNFRDLIQAECNA